MLVAQVAQVEQVGQIAWPGPASDGRLADCLGLCPRLQKHFMWAKREDSLQKVRKATAFIFGNTDPAGLYVHER